MKRYLLAILIAIVVLAVMAYFSPRNLHSFVKNTATCNIFCRSTTAQANSVGFGYVVRCDAKSYWGILAQCQKVDGVSFSFVASTTDFVQLQQKLKLQQSAVQTLGNTIVVCGYSPKLSGGIFVDGNFVNLQIAFDGKFITVGSPLILDSF